MTKRETNGPAFPSTNALTFGDFTTSGHEGMTLRQYAAIAAMQGIVASGRAEPVTQAHFENIAADALQIADTLLKLERETL